MARIETIPRDMAIKAAPGKTADRLRLKAASFLGRPILMGVLALIAALGCCQTYGGTVTPSYQAPRSAGGTPVATAPDNVDSDFSNASESSAVPLLFLSFVGLAGMALSRTGSSKDDRS